MAKLSVPGQELDYMHITMATRVNATVSEYYIRISKFIILSSILFSELQSPLVAATAQQQLLSNSQSGISLVHIPMTNKQVSATVLFSRIAVPGPVAHYAEHLTWLPNIGLQSRPLDRDTNAWTAYPTMGYWQTGRPEDLADILRKLAKVFDPIALPRDFAEQERDIILKEYDLRVVDNPDGKATEAMNAFLYAGNGIAASTLGTPVEIRAMTFEDAVKFHNETHRPELARLVVSGDISEAELHRALRKSGFPHLGSGAEEPPAFTLSTEDRLDLNYPDETAAPRMIWRKVVTLPKPIAFDLLETQCKLLASILETNLPGGLAGPLRYDATIAWSFSVSITPLDEDNVEITFTAEPDKGVSFTKLQQAFEASLAASAKGIPPETFDRVLKRFEDYWPDWEDREETGKWMASYTLDRVANLRQPLSERRVRHLQRQLNVRGVQSLLAALSGPGRIAIATIGKDQGQ